MSTNVIASQPSERWTDPTKPAPLANVMLTAPILRAPRHPYSRALIDYSLLHANTSDTKGPIVDDVAV
jgi:hypothetical protein